MPFGDGTGPRGQGPQSGRGLGRSQGRGRMGGETMAGPGGQCICPSCGHKVPHQIGQPCYSIQCPKCGAKMGRN